MPSEALLKSRPSPSDESERDRWLHTGKRWDMVFGDWSEHAAERVADFYAAEVQDHLPPAETSLNPAKTITRGKSTLYDDPVAVSAEGADDEDVAILSPPESWALMQEMLTTVNACNDCFVLSRYMPGRGLYETVVPPHHVEVRPDPLNPSQPAWVRHTELSVRPVGEDTPASADPCEEWTRTTWDLRDPSAPFFQVEAYRTEGRGRAAEWVVATDEYVRRADGRSLDGAWPFPASDGSPIWPWIAYHGQVSNQNLRPYQGAELFSGTLTIAAEMTWWLMGLRDGANPQRYVQDVEVVNAGTTATTGDMALGGNVVRLTPTTLLQLRSKGERAGSVGQFPPAMEPKGSLEAILMHAVQLAINAGVSPSDVSISGGGTLGSGVAIHLSRDGQRKARKALVTPMRLGDRRRLATNAKLVNAALGLGLPEEPEAYSIRYGDMERTLEEVRQDIEEDKALVEHGVRNRVDVYLRYHPGLTREQAIEAIALRAAEEAQLRAAEFAANGGTPETDKRFLIGDKTTAVDIAAKVSEGTLPGDAARSLMTTMLGLSDDEASQILASVRPQ